MLCFSISLFHSLDPVAVSQFLLHLILTHTSLSLAVQVWLTSHVHNGIKQQSHCWLTSCKDGQKEQEEEHEQIHDTGKVSWFRDLNSTDILISYMTEWVWCCGYESVLNNNCLPNPDNRWQNPDLVLPLQKLALSCPLLDILCFTSICTCELRTQTVFPSEIICNKLAQPLTFDTLGQSQSPLDIPADGLKTVLELLVAVMLLTAAGVVAAVMLVTAFGHGRDSYIKLEINTGLFLFVMYFWTTFKLNSLLER